MEEMPHDILRQLAQVEVNLLEEEIEDLKTHIDEEHGRISRFTEELVEKQKRYDKLAAYLKETK